MHQGDHLALKHQIYRFKFTELNEIFWFMSFRSFAISLVAIFIPVYLYKLGYSFQVILSYYIFMYLFEACLEYLSTLMINIYGPKHVIFLSIPFWILHIFQIYTLPILGWPIWTISLSGGATLSLFWQAYHYDFSKTKKKKEATKEVSSLYIVLSIFGALSPFVGGVIATRFGIEYVYVLAMFLLALASIILFRTSDNHNSKKKINLKKLNLKCISKDLISYAGAGWEGAASVAIWPIFVITIVGTYETLGILTSFALISSIFVMYYVGKRADNGERQKYLKFGHIATGFVYLFQVFVDSAFQIGVVNTLRNVTHSFSASPYTSEYYLHADEEGRSEYVLAMETIIDIARVSYFLILLGVSYFFSLKIVLIVGILLGAVGILTASFMPPAKCELQLSNKDIKIMPRPARRVRANV